MEEDGNKNVKNNPSPFSLSEMLETPPEMIDMKMFCADPFSQQIVIEYLCVLYS